jgi:hypothetical protein
MAQPRSPVDSLTESAVRQWLRERRGVAFCCECLVAEARQASNRAGIAAALNALTQRQGFLPGRWGVRRRGCAMQSEISAVK